MEYKQYVKRAIANPHRILPFLKRESGWYDVKYEYHRRKNSIPKQKQYIRSLLAEDEFVLVILDACRFDYFEREIADFLDGDLDLVWSAGNRTPKWTPNLWEGKYDLDYISVVSFPVSQHAYHDREGDFDPEATFNETIHLTYREKLSKTVPPELVTDVVLDHFQGAAQIRGVVHYPQPHEPYVGSTRVFASRVAVEDLQSVAEAHAFADKIPDSAINNRKYVMGEELLEWGLTDSEIGKINEEKYPTNQRVRDGLISDEKLREAYRGNLRYVLSEVKRLVTFLDCPVVVSADHGEHLGEYKHELPRYFHPDQTHPILREVPWFILDDSSKGMRELSEADLNLEKRQNYGSENSKEEVQNHLEALGYV